MTDSDDYRRLSVGSTLPNGSVVVQDLPSPGLAAGIVLCDTNGGSANQYAVWFYTRPIDTAIKSIVTIEGDYFDSLADAAEHAMVRRARLTRNEREETKRLAAK